MRKNIICCFLFLIVFMVSEANTSQDTDFYRAEYFAKRRQALMQKMDGGIAIVSTSTAFPNKNFYYLTGFDETEAACLLIPGEKEEFVLFVRPDNPSRTLWTGKRHGIEGAVRAFGADRAFPLDELQSALARYLRGKTKIYHSTKDKEYLDKIHKLNSVSQSDAPQEVIDLTPEIHALRLVKDTEEVRLLSKAIDITCEALNEVMRAARPEMYEYELEAILEYIFHKKGSPRPGFPSIVGSGINTTILHYESNRRQTRDGELVLMDVGAEYGRYTADVTRTFPINGSFSPRQREVYEIVLAANKKAIAFIKPGVGLYEVNTQAVEVVKEGLLRLGLITDKDSSWQTRVWLMYNTNHWIGLDVHDVGGRGPRGRIGMRLQPGMVLTVEPGIYVGPHSLAVLEQRLLSSSADRKAEIQAFIQVVKPTVEKYMNIGIRIEDDVLVTSDGHEVLSRKAAKEIKEIERLMQETSLFK
jgi:Xaa-Pro aminopeptidase